MKRRSFISSTSGALGLLAMMGSLKSFSGAAAPAAKVNPELQATRDRLMAELEANRGLGVPRVDGEFLHLMAHLTEAKKVLEVGTFRGYSAIWMGLALEQTGGKLTTIDIDPNRVKESKANFERAGLADRITGLEGDGHQMAKTVEGPLDLVFLDAEKGNEVDYFNTVFPKLRPGGILLLHNAITSKKVMQPYLEMVAKHPQIFHVVLSLSMQDGFSVSFKRKL